MAAAETDVSAHPLEHALVDAAREHASDLLGTSSERWRHSLGVAERAAEIATTVPPADRPLLVASAWLHDIGYAERLRDTGFHPYDGAAFLLDERWPLRLAALVAHHSGARFVADVRGLRAALDRFPLEDSPLADALTYADQTVGPNGRRMDVRDRLADTAARHGPESPNAKARPWREPWILTVAQRVQQRLRRGLLTPDQASAGFRARMPR